MLVAGQGRGRVQGLGTQGDRGVHKQSVTVPSDPGCVLRGISEMSGLLSCTGRDNPETCFPEVGVICSWLLSTHRTRSELALLLFPFKLPSCCFMFLLCLNAIVKLLYLVVGFTSKCLLLNN